MFGKNSFKINGQTVLFGTGSAAAFLFTDFVGHHFNIHAHRGPAHLLHQRAVMGRPTLQICNKMNETPIPGAVWLFEHSDRGRRGLWTLAEEA